MQARRRLFVFVALHLLLSAAIASAFAWRFGHDPRAVLAHAALLAEWHLVLLALFFAFAGLAPTHAWPRRAYFSAVAATFALQLHLYALNLVSNLSWGRNITGHLVAAFAPTIWSGREPFPVGARGLSAFTFGTITVAALLLGRWRPDVPIIPLARNARWRAAAAAALIAAVFASTLGWAVEARDDLLWKQELIASFFRPDGFAFEPTARRYAVADRDALLQAAYPRNVASSRRKNVVLIIVDSLRADHMQVYGYQRPTTPFLSSMVKSGRMKRVEDAFSSCSESFCGITSTLSSREFRDISARTFQLQDVLRDEGYKTWFLLSGNHRAWNGLPQFYRATDDTFFDGSETERYTMDDDRVVLEALERVPPAVAGQPAFFYVHLMSPHYLGVQLPESHVFTRPDDTVSPGLEPYKILAQLNKPERYDDKVRQADGIIRQVFAALAVKHYLDDVMVVITGDHGEGLGERHWAHGWDLHNEDIRIPLLLYDVPAARYRDLTFGVQVDIAPTILDRLGLPIPASWEGESLLSQPRARFTHHQTYFVPNRFAVLYRDGGALFKFIATPEYGTEELYDLRRDRGETHSLVDKQPELASQLRKKIDDYRLDR